MKSRSYKRSGVRRTSVPRRKSSGFVGMLAKLGLASDQLRSARSRRR